MLQHTAVRGLTATWSRTATHCNTLQHTATHCNILPHAATHCNSATHCNTLQHTATHCNTLQHTTARVLTATWSRADFVGGAVLKWQVTIGDDNMDGMLSKEEAMAVFACTVCPFAYFCLPYCTACTPRYIVQHVSLDISVQ